MTYLTEEEETALDKNKEITLIREGTKFYISLGQTYCYGDVDFSEGSDDLDQIATFSFMSHLIDAGVCIPSDYHYNEHACNSPIGRIRYTETFKPEVLARYAHAVLNKPKKIILFYKKIR